MKGILANLLVKLGLDSKEYEKGIDEAKKKTNVFGEGIKKIGGLMAGLFAVDAIKGFAQNVFQLGKEAIKIENELTSAIRANGKEVKSTLADYERFTKEMMSISTIDDEAISGMLRLAETLQSVAPKEAVKNAMALSKALGVDLNTAVKMAVMAQSDMYTMLGRYVPALREAGTEAERTAEYNKLLTSGLTIMADEAKSTLGVIEQNRIAWDNLKESIGKAFIQSKLFSGTVKEWKQWLDIISSDKISVWQKLMASVSGNYADYYETVIKESEANDKRRDSYIEYVRNLANEKNVKTEIVLTEEQLAEAKKKAFEAWEKENEAIRKQVDLLQLIDDAKTQSLKSLTGGYNPNLGLGTEKEAPTIAQAAVMMTDEQGTELFDTKAYKKKLEDFAAFKEDFAYMVQDFGAEVVDELGAAFGELIATGDFPEDFGKNILVIIGGFISQLGKMLIGLGVAAEAFQKLLASAFTNPVSAGLAIAAGAALVLLGGALSSAAKAGPKGASSGGGGGYSVSSQSYSSVNNAGNRPTAAAATIEVQGVLKGDSIFLSNQRNIYKRNIIG